MLRSMSCTSLKLRCDRQFGDSCDRCIASGSECVYRNNHNTTPSPPTVLAVSPGPDSRCCSNGKQQLTNAYLRNELGVERPYDNIQPSRSQNAASDELPTMPVPWPISRESLFKLAWISLIFYQLMTTSISP
jgi:hypothetical protein